MSNSGHPVVPDPAADPLRPVYHFLPEANWLNDPNGLLHWQGFYHLFYQYNPAGAFHGTIHWGHARSRDLVHWEHLPIALAPDPGTPDEDGCWSGAAVVHEGVPAVIYTGFRAGEQLPCLATSEGDLIDWHKSPTNPIIAAPPAEYDVVGFRDHSLWKEGEDWYQAIGSGIRGAGGAVFLYRSRDLRTWKYLHPLIVDENPPGSETWMGDMWECPDFFHLDSMAVLVLSIMIPGTLPYTIYLSGDYIDHRFVPRERGLVDAGRPFYAPQSMLDSQGRRLMWGWLREGRSDAAQRAAGWSGVMSLPRVLSAGPDGTMAMAPAPELRILRRDEWKVENLVLDATSPNPLAERQGTTHELLLECELEADTMLELQMYASPDGEETTVLSLDMAARRLTLDTTRSTLSQEVIVEARDATVTFGDDRVLRLHVFLDRSVIEVFANDVTCLTERVYPTRPDSQGLRLGVSRGAARVRSLQVWELASIWNGDNDQTPASS
jgi:beta-fructofuranosidase